MAKTNENGEIALSKGDNDIFTRAWTITDAMLNLTTDERAVLDQFEQKWFDGYSLYAGSLVYENALPVFLRHEGLLRTVRASNPRGSSSEHGIRRGVRKSFGALRFFAMFTGSLRPAWEFDPKLRASRSTHAHRGRKAGPNSDFPFLRRVIGKNVDRIPTLGHSEGRAGFKLVSTAILVIPYSFITLMIRLHWGSHPRGQHVIQSGSLGIAGRLQWRRNGAPTWFELALSNEPPREDGSALQKRASDPLPAPDTVADMQRSR